MARPSRLFVPIDVNYFEDDRILAAGDAWQLHMAALLLCKKILSDGCVSRLQLARVAPDSVSDVDGAIRRLSDVGLFTVDGDQITIRSWNEWHAASEDVTAKRRRASAIGNHKKWGHDNKPSSTCIICKEEGLVLITVPNGSDSDPDRSRKRSPISSLETESEGETESEETQEHSLGDSGKSPVNLSSPNRRRRRPQAEPRPA